MRLDYALSVELRGFGLCRVMQNFISLTCQNVNVIKWAFHRMACQAVVSENAENLLHQARLCYTPAWQPSLSLRSERRLGLTGLEPVTLRLSSACSNQLSYRPGCRRSRQEMNSDR